MGSRTSLTRGEVGDAAIQGGSHAANDVFANALSPFERQAAKCAVSAGFAGRDGVVRCAGTSAHAADTTSPGSATTGAVSIAGTGAGSSNRWGVIGAFALYQAQILPGTSAAKRRSGRDRWAGFESGLRLRKSVSLVPRPEGLRAMEWRQGGQAAPIGTSHNNKEGCRRYGAQLLLKRKTRRCIHSISETFI